MQLQLCSVQEERPRLAVIVSECVRRDGCINMCMSLIVPACLCMCSPEHKYTPNQFKLGHLFTQSNVP